MSSVVYIIDYGCGNLGCVQNALRYLNFEPVVLSICQLSDVDPKGKNVLFPGVGNFNYAVENISSKSSISFLRSWLTSSRRVMCICLGFQLLYSSSAESAFLSQGSNTTFTDGLSILNSTVLPLGLNNVPSLNIGWRRPIKSICKNTVNKELFDLASTSPYYHMHSFGVPYNSHTSSDLNTYDWYIIGKHLNSDVEFISAFCCHNILGLQFHPEKSGPQGLSLIKSYFA